MPIVSSRVEKDTVAKDGKRWVLEVHTDDQGIEHESWYAPQGKKPDLEANLLANRPFVEDAIAGKTAEVARADLLRKLMEMPVDKLADAKASLDQVVAADAAVDVKTR